MKRDRLRLNLIGLVDCLFGKVVVTSCCNGTQALSGLYISSESLNAYRED